MENKIAVTNRSFGVVIYNIPEMGVRREFTPKETKNILNSVNFIKVIQGQLYRVVLN